MIRLRVFVKAEQVLEFGKANGVLISLPQHYQADNTSLRIGDELSRANVVEVQNPLNCGMDGKVKINMKGSLIKGHFTCASRPNGFARLKKPNLNA